MKRISLLLLCVLFIVSLQSCATKPGSDELSPDELKTAGNATLTQQQSTKNMYNNASFVASTNKEEDVNANA